MGGTIDQNKVEDGRCLLQKLLGSRAAGVLPEGIVIPGNSQNVQQLVDPVYHLIDGSTWPISSSQAVFQLDLNTQSGRHFAVRLRGDDADRLSVLRKGAGNVDS